MVADAKTENLLLLILVRQRTVFPLHRSALTRTQFSPTRVNEEYRGALLLEKDGTLFEISRVDCLGAFGSGFRERALSILSGTREARVNLKPANIEFAKLKAIIADCIRANGVGGDPESSFLEREEVAEQLLRAECVGDVFSALRFPAPEDALDIL
jgi:hypothetical protein